MLRLSASEPNSLLGGAGLQGERMQLIAHPAAQRLIHHLVLLDPRLAAKGARHDVGGVMIAIAAQIFDLDLRVRQALLDQPLDHRRIHCHRRLSRSALPHITRKPSLVRSP